MNNMSLLKWLDGAKRLEPSVCDWIGIYFKESFLTGQKSTDLVLGPFIGDTTEHIRIPISKGICGLAVREEKTVNVKDVRANPEHIACSIKTRSELVIPLRDSSGDVIAELDIDCNRLAAFTPEVEEKFAKYSATFYKVIE